MSSSFLRLGIDVGGTNTDAVLLDANHAKQDEGVVKWTKVPTTAGLSSVKNAIKEVTKDKPEFISQIRCVTIGTTYFLNALVERDASKLQKVAVIRLASCNFTRNTPPFVDFPTELRDVILGHTGFVEGGLNVDGTVIGTPSKEGVLKECNIIRSKDIRNIVIVGTFSPIDVEHKQEEVVRDWILEELGDVNVVCSAHIGRLGLLERENAAILNASMLNMSSIFSKSLENALATTGLKKTPLFVSCNDGTMISVEEATQRPVAIIASGPPNSLIGASSLIKLGGDRIHHDQAEAMMVIDIGGSTSDAGMVLNNGYPRQGSAYSEIANVRVNFPMPDVQSIGLGGGSIIKTESVRGSVVAVQVGPTSLGHEFSKRALCFGGNIMTASDIAIAAGDMPNFGDTPVNIDSSIIKSAKAIMQLGLENLVDSIKTKATPLPVALVGGAAALCQSPLRGTSKVLHHEYASVANAIGAARAKLSTTVDKIVPIENGRSSGEDEKILESIISEANRTCVKKGASRDSVKIIFQELVALPYIANKVRAYVQVVGELDRSTPKATDIGVQIPSTTTFAGSNVTATNSSPSTDWTFINTPSQSNHPTTIDLKEPSAIDAYKPKITNGTWHISPTDLSFLSTGTYILGCGGGGSPYLTTLEAHSCLQRGESLRITDISAVPSNSLLLPVVCLGSPIIGIERPGGNLSQDALTNMLAHLDKKSFSAIICVEVGGANGMMNLIVGSSHNVPIIDGDLMGRAFPSFEKITPYVFSSGDINELLPVSMSSGDGTDFIMTHAKDLKMVDRTLRALLVEMGCAAGMVQRPMSGKEMAETGVLRSHSLAWRLGRAVARCKASQSIGEVGSAVVNEFGGEGAAREIFGGKIVGSEERIVGGQSYGEVRIRGSQISKQHREGTEKEDEVLRVVFNNENLIAELQSSSNKPKILATVPSLIIILDALTGTALGVPEYRFGLKVLVLVAAPSPIWTSERGLEIAGPKAFGFDDIDYIPVGKWREPKSVIEEFS